MNLLAQEPFSIAINQTNGLQTNAVYDIYQSQKGFIWFATEIGLIKYDGVSFKTIVSPELTSRAGSCIREDKYGRIWYENFDGFIYYVEGDIIKKFKATETVNYIPYGILNDFILIIQKNRVDAYDLKTFKKKEFIFKEGQPSTHIYFIESGKVKCYMSNSYGKELITGIAGPKELIGYATILNDSEYIENAEALEEIKTWSISRQEFMSMIEKNKALSLKFIRFLSNNLIQLEERLMELAYQPVRQRVAQTLIKLGKKYGNPAGSGKINMSRKDISNVIGTATETLNRMVAEFKDDNLIETTELGLLIKDLKGLERVAKS